MSLDQQRHFLIRAAYWLCVAALAWLGIRYVLVWLLPFLIAFLFAALLEPLILRVQRAVRSRRAFASFLVTLAFLLLLGTLLTALCTRLFAETASLSSSLGEILASLIRSLSQLRARFTLYCARCPAPLHEWLDMLFTQLPTQLSAAFASLSSRALSRLSALLTAVPHILLFAATSVLALFFTTSAYPRIRSFFRQLLSPLPLFHRIRRTAWQTLSQWLRAQLILSALTFAELLIALTFLHTRYPLLTAAVITFVDALPVFGAGTVLIPWALGCFLSRHIPRGIVLLALYALALLTRSAAQPHLLSADAGIPSVVSLLAMYLGFCLFGVWGMLLFPPLALFLIRLFRSAPDKRA